MNEHIHQVGDERGLRKIFVDGVEIKRVTYANTETGEVRHHGDPVEIDRDKNCAIEHTIHGKVEVQWLK